MRSCLARLTPSERSPDDDARARLMAEKAWLERGVLVVNVADDRLTDWQRAVVKSLGAELFGRE